MPMMCMESDPNPSFRWRTAGAVRLLECLPLADIALHGFTTRALDLGRGGTDHQAEWARLAASFDLPIASVVRLRQVHRADIVHARSSDVDDPPCGDVLVSGDPTIAVAVQAADCVPLLMADRRRGAVAAVHAGWRGTAAGAAAAAVEALEATFATRPADLVVAIGPSIGPCCYQVGPEVRQGFVAAGHQADALARWFLPDEGDRLRLDLWRANIDALVACGVPAAAVQVSGLCTAHHTDTFFSYRREGARAGRLAGVIRARRSITA
jgi:polyphenol oxidase